MICTGCGKEFSLTAERCPQCGRPRSIVWCETLERKPAADMSDAEIENAVLAIVADGEEHTVDDVVEKSVFLNGKDGVKPRVLNALKRFAAIGVCTSCFENDIPLFRLTQTL